MRLVKICENVWVNPELVRAVTIEGDKVCVWKANGDDFYVSDLPVEELLAALTAPESPAVEHHVCDHGYAAWTCGYCQSDRATAAAYCIADAVRSTR